RWAKSGSGAGRAEALGSDLPGRVADLDQPLRGRLHEAVGPAHVDDRPLLGCSARLEEERARDPPGVAGVVLGPLPGQGEADVDLLVGVAVAGQLVAVDQLAPGPRRAHDAHRRSAA